MKERERDVYFKTLYDARMRIGDVSDYRYRQ